MITKFVPFFLAFVVQTNAEECIDHRFHGSEIMKCCLMPSGLPPESLTGCIKEAEQKVPDKDLKNYFACVSECFLKKVGVLVYNSVNMKQVERYMEELEPTARDLRMDVWDVCAKAVPGILKNNIGHNLKCHPLASQLKTCVSYLTNRHCPAVYLNDQSEICRKIRSGVKPCEN
ncbi:uncharacterized protein LOC129743595 [Uranotaenia lowii]|uniref:uncharacterized protein LOC129743595 n=1 Tax=Uranotaenia lowii TaxID=190385 RepID=UPI00247A1628|nr:uncharacterized protein LOC129743595 [Uranotaenia lowii]